MCGDKKEAKMDSTTKTRWMLTTLLMVCLLVTMPDSPSNARGLQGGTDFSAVDAYVERQMEALKIPGLALSIVQGNQVAYMHGYGKSGPDGRPVTAQTAFMIGSTTKSFTALAIMQLVEAGKLELDTPVQTYLPWFHVIDPQVSAQITLRQLLNQTGGFSTSTGRQELAAHDQSDNAIETSVRRLADVELAHSPGAVHEYSNVNFNILGLIVQTVSGQTYESYVQEHIFDPLGMRHSFTSQEEAMKGGMATGYRSWFGTPRPGNVPYNRGNLPSGYLICSGEDLAHYLIAQLNDGRYGDASVLSPEGVAEMHKAAVPTESTDIYYGMAWYVETRNGVTVISHSGVNANFLTSMLMIPEEKLGVAVTFNMFSLSASGAETQIAEGVTAIMRGEQPQPYQSFEMLPKMIGSAVAPVVLAVLWCAWMLYRFIVRRRKGLSARGGFLWILWVIVLPFLVDAGLLFILLVALPRLWEGTSLSGLLLFFPDLFTLVIGSAILVAGWGAARVVLTLLPRRNQPEVQA
jgi:CubicO group peptidase (beta-lactamase class C family)